MTERIDCITSSLNKGKFGPYSGRKVGSVSPTGEIEGTQYKFHRPVVGGVAITSDKTLTSDGDDLLNPATGDRFKLTKKGTGYFNKQTGVFVKPWLKESEEGKR